MELGDIYQFIDLFIVGFSVLSVNTLSADLQPEALNAEWMCEWEAEIIKRSYKALINNGKNIFFWKGDLCCIFLSSVYDVG